jgi:dihydroneopterin aldolase
MSDTVLIRGLACHCIVGILDFERVKPQPLLLDLELGADFSRIEHPQDYANIVDYGAVSAEVKAKVEGGEYLLLETLADEVCADLLARYPITSVRLEIRKPDAVAAADWVGIRVVRQR